MFAGSCFLINYLRSRGKNLPNNAVSMCVETSLSLFKLFAEYLLKINAGFVPRAIQSNISRSNLCCLGICQNTAALMDEMHLPGVCF